MKHRVYAAVLVILLVSGCASTQKHSVEKELQNRVGTLEQDVTYMKKSMDEAIKRQAELSMIILSLENKLSDNADKDAAALERVEGLEERADKLPAVAQVQPVTPAAPAVATTPAPPVSKPARDRHSSREQIQKRKILKAEPVSAEKLYQSAYENYEKGRFNEALEQFNDFAARYPKSDLTDNAYYWIGEIYYARKDFSRAILEFQRVVNEFADENKAPEALYKIGLTYLELQNPDKAKQEFRKLINNFPYSEKATMAKEKLASLE